MLPLLLTGLPERRLEQHPRPPLPAGSLAKRGLMCGSLTPCSQPWWRYMQTCGECCVWHGALRSCCHSPALLQPANSPLSSFVAGSCRPIGSSARALCVSHEFWESGAQKPGAAPCPPSPHSALHVVCRWDKTAMEANTVGSLNDIMEEAEGREQVWLCGHAGRRPAPALPAWGPDTRDMDFAWMQTLPARPPSPLWDRGAGG